MWFDTDIKQGVALFSGDPSSVTPVAAVVPVPRQGRGWAYVHVKIAAHGSDTTTVTLKGRLNANGGYVTLKQSDQSTNCSVAQSGGAATEVITTCQLLPDMKVALSGTSTSGASCSVWLEAIANGVRADS
jgi:hypothetical protein